MILKAPDFSIETCMILVILPVFWVDSAVCSTDNARLFFQPLMGVNLGEFSFSKKTR
jgi:hypothetical protein